jgi:hypothetical protein
MTESLEAKLDDIELLDYRFRHRPLRLDCFVGYSSEQTSSYFVCLVRSKKLTETESRS